MPWADIEGPEESPKGAIVAASRPDTHRAASIISAHFSPIMMQAALVLSETTVGMIEASATAQAQEAVDAQLVVDHAHRVARGAHHAGAARVEMVEPRARSSRFGYIGCGDLVEQFAVALGMGARIRFVELNDSPRRGALCRG